MRHNENPVAIVSRADGGSQRLRVITQLLRHIEDMHHIDEVLFWLAQGSVQYLGIPIIQFWIKQQSHTGQTFVKPGPMVCRKGSIADPFVTNEQVQTVAEYILRERSPIWIMPVDKIFTAHQAGVLERYGLHYCCGYFFDSATLPASFSTDITQIRAQSTLVLVMLLFLHQYPAHELQLDTRYVLEQVLLMASKRGLLSAQPDTAGMQKIPVSASGSLLRLSLAELIPQRVQDTNLMKANNPLASSVDIADKLARHVYIAIDGQKSVAELMNSTGLSMEGMRAALKMLLELQRIQFRRPGDKHLIENSLSLQLL